ncbi:MAG: PorT family protein [Balneolia bacterium]|nr:PorT family protein [Balneolia bacterium]
MLPLILLLVSAGTAHSQSSQDSVTGKLITTSADTLYGSILLGDQYDHSWRVRFREEGAESYIIYRPHEVFMYEKNGSFRYFSVEGDFEDDGLLTVFMREDIRGDITLYSTKLTRDRAAFLVRERDGRLSYLQTLFYIDQLRSIFAGCNEFLRGGERISRRYRLTHEGMYSAFASYYECAESEARWAVEPEETSRKTRFGVTAGFNTSNMRITGSNNIYRGVAFDYVPGYTFGVYLDIPVFSKNFFFKPELLFTSRGGEASVPFPLPNPPALLLTDDEIEGSFRYLMFNFPLRYETSLLGVNPYISGGGIIGILVGRNATVNRLTLPLDNDPDAEAEIIENDLFQFYNDISLGLNLGLGVRMPIGSVDLFTEGRYTRIFSNLDDSVDSFRTTALEILVGFSF